MKIAILSDVHAVADVYEAAITAACKEGFDTLLVLGDLLTYGLNPERTLEITRGLMDRGDAILILGNHDQLYLDMAQGVTGYADTLPAWIRETTEWTWSRVGSELSRFDWSTRWSSGRLLAAHANPYAYGDWSYLRTPAEFEQASTALAADGYVCGLFGHTHRFRQHSAPVATVVTVGSLGQPRGGNREPSAWAMAEWKNDVLTIEQRPVGHDWAGHCAAIQGTNMSAATRDRLCGFYQ